MNWLKNIKISKKLITGFLVIAAITAAVGTIGIVMLQQTNSSYGDLYHNYGTAQGTIGKAAIDFNQIRIKTRDILLTADVSKKNSNLNDIKQLETQIGSLLTDFGTTVNTSDGQKSLADLNQAMNDYNKAVDTIINLSLQGKNEEALTELNNAATIAGNADKLITDTFDRKSNNGQQNETLLVAQSTSMEWIMAAIVSAAVAAAIILGMLLSRSITRPLNKIVAAANQLAVGNTAISIDINSKDEVGILAKAIKSVVTAINNLINDADSLVEAANEGRLSTRADVSKHEGDYKKVVEGINSTLDSIMQPISIASAQLEKMANGQDHDEIDVGLFNGDFKLIMNNFNMLRESLYNLLGDTLMLVEAAMEGKLSTRADTSKHKGRFIDVVDGVNKTLDAVIKPVNEAAAVLYEMAKGNLDVNVEGDYKGDLANIKNAMNDTVNTIKSYIDEISAVLSDMAKGDMTQEIRSDYRGAFIALKESINTIIGSMNSMLLEIKRSADQVALGTSQVSNGSQTLAQGTGEQASSIEELTSSIIQISAQTEQNANNASTANELALVARGSAFKGNEQMREMLKSMDEINESSGNISKIIKVIDDIAFQTNILALNAAVEAARAGIHGKGFAVVAEEVRSLAAKSADAAKETTNMIEGSIKKVVHGTQLANETAEALNEIVENVEKASTLVGEIAGASYQQASAIAQINTGLEQVSSVVQSNSATAEESAAASEELSGQAELLKNLAGQFKLKEGGHETVQSSGQFLHSNVKGTIISNKY